MSEKMKLTDLPGEVVEDLVTNYNDVDYYFGDDGKHEHWMRWEYLLRPAADDGLDSLATEFMEIDGTLFLLPMPSRFQSLIKGKSATFSNDGSRSTVILSLDTSRSPEQLGVYFTGAIAIADLYEKHGVSFYLGRYLHQSYLVGFESKL